MNTPTVSSQRTNPIRASRLWLGWWLGGLAWMADLLVSFSLLDWYCHNPVELSAKQIILILHAISLLAIAIALASFVLARRTLYRFSGKNQGSARQLFLARGGWLASGFFIAVITLQSWSNFFMEPCL